jgi:hypothetical protein
MRSESEELEGMGRVPRVSGTGPDEREGSGKPRAAPEQPPAGEEPEGTRWLVERIQQLF